MVFGNYKIKADFGGERITDSKLCDGLYPYTERDLSYQAALEVGGTSSATSFEIGSRGISCELCVQGRH